MSDVQQLSELVLLSIKAAQAPLLERLSASEQAVKDLTARLQEMQALRDRVVTIEAKGALVTPQDMTALQDRIMAALETKAATSFIQVPGDGASVKFTPLDDPGLGEIRDRLLVLETKAGLPLLDGRVDELRDRVVALEAKASTPVSVPEPDLSDITHRLAMLEHQQSAPDPLVAPVAKTAADLETLAKDVNALRERVAVAEVRPSVPGPAGRDGAPGVNGRDGVDGKDGIGFDDVAVDFDGDRTLTVKFQRGLQTKSFPVVLPYLKYQGIWQETTPYRQGDVVTWGGNTWVSHVNTTAKPADNSKDWQLCVRKGRDGKDGVNAVERPVVTVGR